MDSHGTKRQLEKRQLYKGVAEWLAEGLSDEGEREAFIKRSAARIDAEVPAPSAARMREYLRANIVR